MNIRHALPDDLNELARLEEISYPKAESAARDSIRGRLSVFPGHFWLLEDGGELIGFINGMATDEAQLADEMYDRPQMHREDGRWQMIFSVVTAPQHRGHGYAGLIMDRVIADARAQNRLGVVLTCKERLIPFYSKFGFMDEGVSASSHGGVQWHQMRIVF